MLVRLYRDSTHDIDVKIDILSKKQRCKRALVRIKDDEQGLTRAGRLR